MPEPPFTLYLIRHGETAWSLSGQHTGRTDIPLTSNGEAVARGLRPWLATIRFDHVLTSPMRRARATCELAGLGAAAEVEPDLSEWDYGDYEGIRSTEIHATRPEWEVFHDGCPNGETPTDVAGRADRLIAKLAERGGTCALFSHGHFGTMLGVRWISLPPVAGEHFSLSPASISVLGHRAGYPEMRVISAWNIDPAAHPH